LNEKIPETHQDNMDDDEMLPEYDFTGGIRGKHYRAYRQGYRVAIHHADGATTVQHFKPEADTIRLEPDIQKYFPDSEAVNKALRGLIDLIP
jgi:hypothetical protein